jgi:pimeloyl-ACP methyl ester carboxylesterase
MSKWSRRWISPLVLLAVASSVLAQAPPGSSTVGTLKVQRHGDHGRVVILIPGLQRGPWVWQQTIAQPQKDDLVYAATLAGSDDLANASLLQLINWQKVDKPVLIGHNLGGTLALRFAGEHADLISGVVAVDSLPIFPGMERVGAEQRQAMAARYAPMNARSDIQASAQYMAEDLAFDGRA